MRIAIIGAGNVGTALGAGWTKAGHQIIYGVRDPQDEKARELVKSQPKAHVASNLDASGNWASSRLMPGDWTKRGCSNRTRCCGSTWRSCKGRGGTLPSLCSANEYP